MSVVTRFAPSPTGFLHIGGARTALFNWLYTRHHGGVFRLRIEDTDRQRSTPEAVDAIFAGLRWLGLDWDGEAVMQFARASRHAEVAAAMLAAGHAYRCWCTPAELEAMRAKAKAEGRPIRYDGTWRDRDPAEGPKDRPPVIRLRAPVAGESVVDDLVQGRVTVANEQLDDMVLLRADGTPTYMLSVVVDDHDMGITHVIRGDDHLNNAFRQAQIYHAMGWPVPAFAHIPLIHGADGAKLSKRHGALGVEAYRDMGFLPEAMRNYLMRLGWGHGDAEIISDAEAIAWFDIRDVGRAPSRFDMAKLENLNGHYIRQAEDGRLVAEVLARLDTPADDAAAARLLAGMAGLKARARTLVELAEAARFYLAPVAPDDKALSHLTPEARVLVEDFLSGLAGSDDWSAPTLEAAARAFAEGRGAKLGALAQPLRAALTGRTTSPPVFEVMAVLGREEAISRIRAAWRPS